MRHDGEGLERKDGRHLHSICHCEWREIEVFRGDEWGGRAMARSGDTGTAGLHVMLDVDGLNTSVQNMHGCPRLELRIQNLIHLVGIHSCDQVSAPPR